MPWSSCLYNGIVAGWCICASVLPQTQSLKTGGQQLVFLDWFSTPFFFFFWRYQEGQGKAVCQEVVFKLTVWKDDCLLSKRKAEIRTSLVFNNGDSRKGKMGKRGWRSKGNDNWNGEGGWVRKKKAEVALVAFISKKYIAVPLTPYASLAHVPG